MKDLTRTIVQQWCMLAGVCMEHVQISTYPLKEQLQLLSQATVMVSNIGSRSFRLIYLPNGASTILVGPPEYHPLLEHPNLPPISAGPAGSFSMYSYTRGRSTYASGSTLLCCYRLLDCSRCHALFVNSELSHKFCGASACMSNAFRTIHTLHLGNLALICQSLTRRSCP